MQETRSSNPPVVTGISDPNKSRARQDRRIDNVFMISKCSKTSHSHRLLLNLTDKINLKRSAQKWKKMKKSYKNNKLRNLLIMLRNVPQMHLKLL